MSLDLDYIFHPRSIAVAGASPNPRGQGHSYFSVLKEFGFKGPVYPVNPEAKEVLGTPAYASIAAIPGELDYVISSVPATAVLHLLDECVQKNVKVLHLFTGRFGETGHAEAAALEHEVLRRARRAGIRLIGPNCMGLYYPREGISFKHMFPREPGGVAVLSQSGGNAAEIVLGGAVRGVRFSKVLSYGNALDLNEADYLEYLADDPETTAIGMYLEGVHDGPRFLRALRRTTAIKPVVIVKAGRTQAGSRAVASHTASLAGAGAVWEAACRQAGGISVSTVSDLVDALVAFNFLPQVRGPRVAVVGGGGGRSVQSADICEEAGLQVSPLPPDVQAKLRERDPQYWDWISNPVDGSILGASPWKMNEILALVADSPDYDMLLVNIDELWALDDPRGAEELPKTLESLLRVHRDYPKPLAIVIGDSIQPLEWQTRTVEDLRRRCAAAGVPLFSEISKAAYTLRRVWEYHRRNGKEEG